MNKRLTTEQELERLLDEDGGEFGAIYGRLSRPEPPRRLDRVVLANAARAVHGGRAPRAQRWALAMGSVAGVVLAAGIAWQVGQEMQTLESVPEGSRSMQDARVVPVEAITEPRPRQKAKSDLIMRDADAPAESNDEARNRLAPLGAQARPSASSPAAATSPPAPATPAAPPPLTVMPDAPAAQSLLEKSARPQATSAATGQSEAEAFPEVQDAVPSDSESRSERVQPAARKLGAVSGGNAASQESRRATAEPQAAAAPAAPADDSLDTNMQLSPQAWLEEIERLANSGKRQQAIENLRLFRRQYPEWPLPDTLRQLEQ